MQEEENKNTLILGKPMGDWIYWFIACMIAFSTYYVSSQVSPLASDIEKIEKNILSIESKIQEDKINMERLLQKIIAITNEHERIKSELKTKVTKERLEIELQHINRDIDYVKSEHHIQK